MDKNEQILHYHRIDGISQREIARRGGSRKTVKRYITEYETLAQADPEEGINMCLAGEPKQNSTHKNSIRELMSILMSELI